MIVKRDTLGSWILESLELVQLSENIVQFVRKSIKNRNRELASWREDLTKVNTRKNAFQGG